MIVVMNAVAMTGTIKEAIMAITAKRMQRGLLLMAIALPGLPAWAGDVGDVAKQNTSSAPQAELSWMSGGIGDDARDEMRKVAAAYSVHLVFSNQQGAYLAGIPFVVTQLNGHELYSGVSAGPLLYLKLPPGSYQIAAKIDGAWHNKHITAGTSENPVRVSFVGNAK
jgi:hypothetical protein